MIKKKSCIGTTISIFNNNLQKYSFKKSFIWGKTNWAKKMQSLFKTMLLIHCILFALIW